MRKKLVLINPVNSARSGLSINPGGRFPPLGLGIVAALTTSNWDIELIDENFEIFSFREADLVGITSFTANINRAYEIAGMYRLKGISTVIGGIHVSMLPDEAAKFADTIVVGSAEWSWPKVLKDFESGKLKKIYKDENQKTTTISGARHDLFHPGYTFDSIQTARGCPMDCHFCSVTAFNGGFYRQRSIKDVLDELEATRNSNFYFVDDNIYGYGKNASERAIALFKGIIDRGLKKEWFSQASLNFAENDEVMEYAARSGCRMILLGIESEDPAALKNANKNLNLKLINKYKEIFSRINSHGIAVLGSFIYGMDGDTKASLSQRTEYILNNNIDVAQISLMTPLPGTRLFSKLEEEERLIYTDFPKDWDHYDMTEVVFKPLLMEPDELYEILIEGYFRIFNPVSLWYKYLRTFTTTRSLQTACWAYASNLNYFNTAMAIYWSRPK